MKFPFTGLYGITQTEGKTDDRIICDVESALQGGITVIQYRDKRPHRPLQLARHLRTLCRRYNSVFIVNDDIELAYQLDADGVHLGKEDATITAARHKLGTAAIIGCSCYNDINRALLAQQQGANYVAFGRFFPSDSKPLATPASITTLQQAKQQINIPIVAIGGILPENGQLLLTAGADILAVIGGLFGADPKRAAQDYLQLFQ